MGLFSTLAAALMMTRREDDPEAGNGAEPITRYAKQIAPMIVVALLTAGGFQLSPMAREVSDSRGQLSQLVEDLAETKSALAETRADIRHLNERFTEISTRRTAQVAELERRVLTCEIEFAKHTGTKSQK